MEYDLIFVDESGNASRSKAAIKESKYFALGFVYCRSPETLRKHLRRLLKDVHERKKYPKELTELKFFLPVRILKDKYGYEPKNLSKYIDNMDMIRRKSIEVINRYGTGIYAAVCDKTLADPKLDSSEVLGNWLFANTLCKYLLPKIYYDIPPLISYDKGRLTAAASRQFNLYLIDKDQYLRETGIRTDSNRLGDAREGSSHLDPGIWAADIVAGAFRHKFQGNDPTYSSLFSKKIGKGSYFYWVKKGGGPRGTPNQA